MLLADINMYCIGWMLISQPAPLLATAAPMRTFKRRSEIDRRLEGLAKRSNGRVLTQNKQTVIKVGPVNDVALVLQNQFAVSQQL